MNGLWTMTLDSFLLLRRDRIFIPAIIGGALIGLFANLASDWILEEYTKVLFDIGAFGFHLIGSIVAVFWGTKAIADARSEGALEMQAAMPVSRTTIILGKFLGLVLNLTLLAVILIGSWQLLMMANGFGSMKAGQILVFVYLYLSWCVTAALAIFFASFAGQAVALFSTFCAWLVGLSTAHVAATLAPETATITAAIVTGSAWIWDFQRFNLVSQLTLEGSVPGVELLWNASYALFLIAMLMTAASLIFRKKDLLV